MARTARSNLEVQMIRLVVCAAVVVAWEVAGRYSKEFSFFFGTPYLIVRELAQLVWSERFHEHVLITGAEALTGLACGTIIGVLVGLSLWYSRTVAQVAHPFIVAAGAIPVFAFAPIMIVWFGIGFAMKVMLAMFATVFVAFSQAHAGAEKASKDYESMLDGFGASNTEMFQKVIVPGSLGLVLNSMRLNVGFALMGAFIGEFISSERGLGYLILRAAGLYNMPRALAAAIGLVLLALLLDLVAAKLKLRDILWCKS